MKKLLFLFALFIGITANSQRSKTIVHYKSGDIVEGYSRGIKYDYIKFKEEKKGKTKKIKIDEIDKVIIYHKTGKATYHHLYVEKKNKEKEFFARLIGEEGTINQYLYSKEMMRFSTFNNGNYSYGNGFIHNNNTQHTINNFYLKKKTDKNAVFISDMNFSLFGQKIFKKNAVNFFNDCPKLVDKIKSKEFKKYDMVEIVEFYNDECN